MSQKLILITGASRGIGAATARLAALSGYQVVVNYCKDGVSAEEVVAAIKSNGGKAVAIQGDVSNEKDVIHVFDQIDNEFGRIDGLVNNAGILETQMKLEGMSVSRLRKIFDTNVIGSFLCCREAVKRMSVKQGGNGGAIVNVSSIAAKTGSPGEYIDYAASKGALDTFTIGLAKEVAEDGIRVNSVRPAFIYTDIHADGGEPARVERIKERIPMKRGGMPIEVAEAIMWLISDRSSYSSGTFIDVSGGV